MQLKGTPDAIKAQYDRLVQMITPMLPPMPENVDVKEGDVDGIKYRTYTPKGEKGPFPIGIWTHGGGLMVGDLNADEFLCRVVSGNAKTAVVNVDYRLTPEHRWPAQLDDTMKVYRWVCMHSP